MKINRLSAGYGDVMVIRDIDVEVRRGEVVTLLGVNGAGKTTLLRAASGLIPASGTVELGDADLTHLPAHQRVSAGLVHVPEGRQLFGELTVEENLLLGGYTRSARQLRGQRLAEVFELFPVLADRRKQRADTMSGGEQQMLAIGRGLVSGPRFLLLDEPSLGVAPVIMDKVIDALRAIAADGIGVLLAEQNAVQALEIADRVYVVDQGRITASGPAAEYLNPERLAQAYLGADIAAQTLLGEEAQ